MSFENEAFETESGEPTKSGKKSPKAVLTALAERPLEQARKLEQYLVSCEERKAALVKLCTPKALAFVNESNPNLIK